MCSGLDKLWAKRLAVWISCRIIGFSEYFSRRRARITREFSETKELCRDYSRNWTCAAHSRRDFRQYFGEAPRFYWCWVLLSYSRRLGLLELI